MAALDGDYVQKLWSAGCGQETCVFPCSAFNEFVSLGGLCSPVPIAALRCCRNSDLFFFINSNQIILKGLKALYQKIPTCARDFLDARLDIGSFVSAWRLVDGTFTWHASPGYMYQPAYLAGVCSTCTLCLSGLLSKQHVWYLPH